MHDISKVEVIVPLWAKDIEDQNILCFIAFLYRINAQFGYHEYGMVKSDINTILASATEAQKFIVDNYPTAKQWLTIKSTSLGMCYVTLKQQYRDVKAGLPATCRVNINQPRPLLIWTYLLGAFNRNLITDNPFPYRTDFTMFNEDRKLFTYTDYQKRTV